MILFKDRQYEIFFTNDIVPFQALAFAGEEFFVEFERLCGKRYRVLSIIRNGEQEKYGISEDLKPLANAFRSKIKDKEWSACILDTYENYKSQFTVYLADAASHNYRLLSDEALSDLFLKGFDLSVKIAAVSNMLHMFSSLVGQEFLSLLSKYSTDQGLINQNHIYYTQPLKESRFSKIPVPELKTAFELSSEEKNFSTILRIGSYVKGDGSALFAERTKQWEGLLKEVARRVGISDSEDTLYLFPEEIRSMLLKLKAPLELISARRSLTVLFYQNKKLETYEGEKGELFLRQGKFMAIIQNRNGEILKGQPASPGKAKGRAVVTVGLVDALASVRKGDILVTGYTSARYVPAMKRAVAIVTETGGITAHAAVVSRELGVPCVISVKDVTKIIQTGDLVEVDADKGVVKIIKKV